MEKDHFRSRNANDRRKGANVGYRGRGNASGSISYTEFLRSGGSKARDERNKKLMEQKAGETQKKSHFGDSFAHSKSGDEHSNGQKSGRKEYSVWSVKDKSYVKDGAKHTRQDHASEHDNFNQSDRSHKAFNKDNRQRKQTQPTYEKTQFVDYSKPMRLNRFLANAGVCSRREADSFIQAGVVSVNGNIVTELGSRVIPDTDRVLFHNDLVKIERRVYILLNKPKDCVTTAEDVHAKKTVLDLVKGACAERVYPVGRLDRNTTGVLLITNDGELTSKLTHPSFNKKKIYQVTLDHDVTDADVKKITNGIMLEDGEIKVDEFSFIKDDRRNVGVEIHSGRNRIVRRIFESLGYKVMRLDRVYFAGLTKKNLPRGKWRFLSEKEVVFLKMNANNPTDNW